MNIGLQQAINIAGSQKALAKLITEKTGNRACTQAVQQWCAKGFPPIKRVPDIVKALHGAVKADQLRPDFFLGIEQGQLKRRPHMARKPEPQEAVTLLRLPPWKAELLRKAAHRNRLSINKFVSLCIDDVLYEGRRYDGQGVLRRTIGDKG